MILEKLIVKNFKFLKDTTVLFNEGVSIIVGDNESGKSTLLEAINLALCGQLNGRAIQYELSPYLFNTDIVKKYIEDLGSKTVEPPRILIEAYFKDEEKHAKLKGTNNSLKENVPGVFLSIEFDESYVEEYKEYIKDPKKVTTVPVEYYRAHWCSFAHNLITSRSIPINLTYVDTTLLRINNGTDRYILKIIDDVLSVKQRADLALTFRKLKEDFAAEDAINEINKHLAVKKGEISDKELTVSIDISPKTTWDSNLTPHLNEIPFSLIGKGEQNCIKMKLALEATIKDSSIFLIEEPENHLSYANMNKLIKDIGKKCEGKQLIITTHSAFVLNKLGLDKLILFKNGLNETLNSLTESTKEYFMKLPGYDTLRLILSKRAILVEGPSDELVVQKAYLVQHKKLPIEDGIDVISVRALAFRRFLEIADPLKIEVSVVTDNDGDIDKLKKKYESFKSNTKIRIHYDADTACNTLEPQFMKVNSLAVLNDIFETEYKTNEEMFQYMTNNKTDYALKIFSSSKTITFPQYIQDAIK